MLETNILLQKLVREFLQPVFVSQIFFFQVGSPVPRLALNSPSSCLHLSYADYRYMRKSGLSMFELLTHAVLYRDPI